MGIRFWTPHGSQCGHKLLRVNANAVEEVLLQRAVVMIFAVLAGERGAALVEHARQQDEAAEASARTAGRTLGEVGGGQFGDAHVERERGTLEKGGNAKTDRGFTRFD